MRHSFHLLHVAAVRHLELDSLGKICEIASDEVVAAADLVPGRDKGLSQMTSQKSGRAGNKNLHACSKESETKWASTAAITASAPSPVRHTGSENTQESKQGRHGMTSCDTTRWPSPYGP